MENNNNFWQEYKLIKSIQKSKSKKINIALVKKEKVSGLDIREYYKDKETGNYLPGARGLVVPDECIAEFIQAIVESY